MKRTIHGWLPLLGLAVILALSLAVTATQASAQAQGSGVIDGQVINGSAGGPAIGSGITVTLHVIQGEDETGARQTTTDAAGRFRFEGLATGQDWAYWIEAVYLDVPYMMPQVVTLEEGQTTQIVTLPVYEVGDDGSQIAIDSGHIIVESFGTVLRISEVYLLSNGGDRTYAGRPGPDGLVTTVGLPIPSDAMGLAFTGDVPAGRFVQSGERLLDTEPVPPGQETLTISYSYHLPVRDSSVRIERSYDYPVSLLQVLLAQPGLALRSGQLLDGGVEPFGDRQFAVYVTGAALPAGAPLSFDLAVQAVEAAGPAATAAGAGKPISDNQGLLRALGFGLAGLAVLAAVLYPLLTARRRPPAAALASNPQARPLLAELAGLEEAFEAGQLDEEAYRRQRAEKWEALRSL